MAFELPFPPFPHDSRDVPFIATPDDNNGYAVPSSQYFKKLVGEKYLWTPVSSTDPLPSSDAAAQAKLADILTKLSADPATQTTLAQILAKIIDAPATEAKQTALNALVGEVQAAPTPNTLLARLKNLETKVDAIIADGLKLSGRNVEVTTIINALAITDTTNKVYNYDASKYKDIDFIIVNTLDQPVQVAVILPAIGFAAPTITLIKTSDGSIAEYYPGGITAKHIVPVNSRALLLSNLPLTGYSKTLPYKDFLQPMRFIVRCNDGAPTEGALSVYMIGVIN